MFWGGGGGVQRGRGEGTKWRKAQNALSPTFLCLSAVPHSGERSLSAALTCTSSPAAPSVTWVLVVASELALGSQTQLQRGPQSAGREGLLFLLLAFIHKIV